MFKISKILVLFITILYAGVLNCAEDDKKEGELSLENVPLALPNPALSMPPNYETIKFGQNLVTVFDSNEIMNENGTITTRLSLSNGIFFNITSVPKESNETQFYTLTGTFEFQTPDMFSYTMEFEVDPHNFKLIKFERKENIFQLGANPKILAALAGR